MPSPTSCSARITEHRLQAAGVATVVPKSESNGRAFHRDPGNQAIGRIAQVSDRGGPVRARSGGDGSSLRAAVAPHRLAPALGVDADTVLSELGYTAAAIAELRARGSIR